MSEDGLAHPLGAREVYVSLGLDFSDERNAAIDFRSNCPLFHKRWNRNWKVAHLRDAERVEARR